MTDGHSVRVVLPFRADDLLDLGLEQPAQHSQPDLDRPSEQPLSGRPDQLAQRLLTRSGSTVSSLIASATGTFDFTAVPPSILTGSPITLPPGADGPEGPRSPQSSASLGTTSQAGPCPCSAVPLPMFRPECRNMWAGRGRPEECGCRIGADFSTSSPPTMIGNGQRREGVPAPGGPGRGPSDHAGHERAAAPTVQLRRMD